MTWLLILDKAYSTLNTSSNASESAVLLENQGSCKFHGTTTGFIGLRQAKILVIQREGKTPELFRTNV